MPTQAVQPANPHLSQVWIAANAVQRIHLLRDVEEVAGNPVLQIHYAHGDWSQPMDLVVELESVENQRRKITWRVTKNYADFGDFFHLTLEMHPFTSIDGAECILRIRYGDDTRESRLIWPRTSK